MVERIDGMNAAFLEMESATMHLHIVGVVVVDPSTAPEPVTPERLAQVYAERLHLIPPLRHRLVPVPGRLDRPRWVDDPDVDLDAHIHHHRLGPGAGRTDLERFVDVLDRTMRAINSDYDAKRRGDMALRRPVMHSLPVGTFHAWMKQRGKLGGQNKVPRLHNDRTFIDALTAHIHA